VSTHSTRTCPVCGARRGPGLMRYPYGAPNGCRRAPRLPTAEAVLEVRPRVETSWRGPTALVRSPASPVAAHAGESRVRANEGGVGHWTTCMPTASVSTVQRAGPRRGRQGTTQLQRASSTTNRVTAGSLRFPTSLVCRRGGASPAAEGDAAHDLAPGQEH